MGGFGWLVMVTWWVLVVVGVRSRPWEPIHRSVAETQTGAMIIAGGVGRA
jgi:hypothetical protein